MAHFEERRDGFADETGVFGLNMMRPHVPKLEKAFWFIVTLFFSVYTTKELVRLTQSYLDEELVTSVAAMKNKTIVFDPPLSVQFALHPSFLQIDPNLIDLNLLEMLDNFRSAYSESKRNPNAKQCSMQKGLTRLDLKLLWQLFLEERNALSVFNRDWSADIDLEQISPKLRTIFAFYQKENISLIDVKTITGVCLCKEARVSMGTPDGKEADVCAEAHLVDVSYNGFKLRPTTGALVFASTRTQMLEIAYAHDTVYRVSLELSGGSDAKDDSDVDVPIYVESERPYKAMLSVRPLGVFQRADTPKHPCTHQTVFDCVYACFTSSFLACANCSSVLAPTRHLPDTRNVPACANTHSMKRGSNEFDLYNFSVTLSACSGQEVTGGRARRLFDLNEECLISARCSIDKCEIRTYSHTKEITPGKLNSTMSAIGVVVESFSYPLFRDRPELTWEKYLSDFGGTLGLCLGLSFAALLHIPVFCVRNVCKAVQRRQKNAISPLSSGSNTDVNCVQPGNLKTEPPEEHPSLSLRLDLMLTQMQETVSRVQVLEALMNSIMMAQQSS